MAPVKFYWLYLMFTAEKNNIFILTIKRFSKILGELKFLCLIIKSSFKAIKTSHFFTYSLIDT